MVIYLSRGKNDAEVSIQFPAEPDTVWPIITQLDECSISAEPIKIAGVFCPISNLAIICMFLMLTSCGTNENPDSIAQTDNPSTSDSIKADTESQQPVDSATDAGADAVSTAADEKMKRSKLLPGLGFWRTSCSLPRFSGMYHRKHSQGFLVHSKDSEF